jgi:hypothetical protein
MVFGNGELEYIELKTGIKVGHVTVIKFMAVGFSLAARLVMSIYIYIF